MDGQPGNSGQREKEEEKEKEEEQEEDGEKNLAAEAGKNSLVSATIPEMLVIKARTWSSEDQLCVCVWVGVGAAPAQLIM